MCVCVVEREEERNEVECVFILCAVFFYYLSLVDDLV